MHYALAASQPKIVDAVLSLAPRGNAIDLAVAGVFAGAAISPSALLGPVQILVGGGGAGLRAFDGRTRQPGAGAPRPRGFLPRDTIPEAAYVGVPVLPAALAAVHALAGELSFARVIAPAVALAKDESDGRRELLSRVARRGALALGEGDFAEDFLAAAGRLGGGLLTQEDFATVGPSESECHLEQRTARAVARVPWYDAPLNESIDRDSTESHIVAAADARGRIAIATYAVSTVGLDLPTWGVLAPRTAAPVRRGEPRARPGEPRNAVSPIVLLSADGVLGGAIGFGGRNREQALNAAVETFLSGMPIETIAPESSRPTGVVRTPSSARTI